MSLCSRSRRWPPPVSASLKSKTQSISLPFRPLLQTRHAHTSDQNNANPEQENIFIQRYRQALKEQEAQSKQPADYRPPPGNLSSSSVFAHEFQGLRKTPAKDEGDSNRVVPISERPLEHMQRVLDPNPIARKRWQRKMVIRAVKKRYKLSKEEIIKQTERESAHHSDWWYTSTKKLMMLARQIAGKTLEDALVQMRFSKKRHAASIRIFLKEASDEAIVARGMGLGKALEEPTTIELKDGKRHKVKNTSEIYIDSAWVVRGSYTVEPEYRARGRVNRLRHPQARIHVVFKEEATRLRQAEERQDKRDNRKVWQHLPDRPITAQRQYCLW